MLSAVRLMQWEGVGRSECGVVGWQVCESTGVVVAPYLDYPQLLGVLLRLLGETADKQGVLRLLGVLGALDPHQHKSNQANLKVTPPSLPPSFLPETFHCLLRHGTIGQCNCCAHSQPQAFVC